ncbi:MAG TPA: sigma-70 family RNA polymerase sigma factor [Acidimicrobiia bacterium]|jgi:RNA polymerase sigma-70 factor (ECF subfamily)
MEDEFGRAWRVHRRHVLDIAFRMLGNVAEAEDVVQEAFARLVAADLDQIDDAGGWLVVVVSRLCLDRLRADRRHPTEPEAAVGDRPGDRAVDPADRVTLDDNVRMALHLVLERLTAAERTVFVLHDVFQYPFEAIARIVGRTPVACRQLASRARRTVTADASRTRFVVEPAEQRRVTEEFIAACSGGDLEALLQLLDPSVGGEADVGGRIGVTTVTGRGPVAAGLLQFFGPASSTTLLSLPVGGRAGEAGVVALRNDRVVTIATLTVRDGRIVHIDAVADPRKLGSLRAALGA